MLRVPVLQAGGFPSFRSSEPWPTQSGQDTGPSQVPSALLEHIRLYRRVQLNWQAFDAYARVSLFVGANSLLYSCLYWSLGELIQTQRATVPTIGIAIVIG